MALRPTLELPIRWFREEYWNLSRLRERRHQPCGESTCFPWFILKTQQPAGRSQTTDGNAIASKRRWKTNRNLRFRFDVFLGIAQPQKRLMRIRKSGFGTDRIGQLLDGLLSTSLLRVHATQVIVRLGML